MAMKVVNFVAFLLLALSAVDCWFYNKDGIPNWLTNPGENVIYYYKNKKIVILSNPSLHQITKGHVHETLTHSLFKALKSKQNYFTKYLGKERTKNTCFLVHLIESSYSLTYKAYCSEKQMKYTFNFKI